MTADESLERYSRQMRFPGIGEAGQRRLLDSHVTLCGCGALGTVLANALVRAGVGHLRLVDRDFIETNNLQRQVLFDEQDVAQNLPKAEAAAAKVQAAAREKVEGAAPAPTGPGEKPEGETKDKPPNTVLQVLEHGYMNHDRVLRPAKVIVSK